MLTGLGRRLGRGLGIRRLYTRFGPTRRRFLGLVVVASAIAVPACAGTGSGPGSGDGPGAAISRYDLAETTSSYATTASAQVEVTLGALASVVPSDLTSDGKLPVQFAAAAESTLMVSGDGDDYRIAAEVIEFSAEIDTADGKREITAAEVGVSDYSEEVVSGRGELLSPKGRGGPGLPGVNFVAGFCLPELPETALEPGASWDTQVDFQLGGGSTISLPTTNTYREKTVEGVTLRVFTTTINSPIDAEAGLGDLAGALGGLSGLSNMGGAGDVMLKITGKADVTRTCVLSDDGVIRSGSANGSVDLTFENLDGSGTGIGALFDGLSTGIEFETGFDRTE